MYKINFEKHKMIFSYKINKEVYKTIYIFILLVLCLRLANTIQLGF